MPEPLLHVTAVQTTGAVGVSLCSDVYVTNVYALVYVPVCMY